MPIDDLTAEPLEISDEYFRDQGFEGKDFEINTTGKGESLEEAIDSANESTYGIMQFEKEDIELTFTYNPMTEDGDIEIQRYGSEAEDDIERYVDDLEDLLEGEIEYSLGGED